MTYLGFPGPTGHPCIDYVIADRYLIPDREMPYYSEKPLYLPHIFQCSDRLRPVGALPTRADCGLPEDAFVFCCFNNNYKFTEQMFDSWMHILQAVPGSVLWLLADNTWSQQNMVARATACGVDASRLIFAPRVSPEMYLARYTAAHAPSNIVVSPEPSKLGASSGPGSIAASLTRRGYAPAVTTSGNGRPVTIASIAATRSARSYGLGRNPTAPLARQLRRSWSSVYPETSSTRAVGSSARSAAKHCAPLMPGIDMSMTTTANPGAARHAASPASPPSAATIM